jgi:hypothetical protein
MEENFMTKDPHSSVHQTSVDRPDGAWMEAQGEDEADVWSVDVERAFQEAYELFPNTGRTKTMGADGKLYGSLSL